ncbi:hypothetical protein [Streptomyces sp. SID5910]|uniref:hypothetical protein n=1 Tax=Streptomyces sp. SID5910 TaxID=2690312 RepID=UPI0013718A22|nr:hypothetical protein [Streptomyces sp. SID5910]MYR43117.1 hypothetical protein [Streptomyces sp. SID5910]
MTEYTATCNSRPSDSVTARADGRSVELEMRVSGDYRGEAYLTPDKARTFARGILALADEIDGGETEVPILTLPAIGTRFQVTEDGLNSADVKRGAVVTVSGHHNDYFGTTAENGVRWYFSPKHIGDGLEPVSDEPSDLLDETGLAGWERDLIGGAKTSAPTKVGDRVEIVRAEWCDRDTEGRTGVVDEVDADDEHLSFRIVDEAGDFIAWAAEVRKVDAPADGVVKVGDYVEITRYRSYSIEFEGLHGYVTQVDDDSMPYLVATTDEGEVWAEGVRRIGASAPDSTRSDLVKRAQTALAGTNPTAADIIRLAEFLAG